MADNAEVLAAAERAFGGPSGYGWCSVEDARRVHPDLMRDLEKVARWAIAHIDAQRRREEERANPVTREAIKSLGGKEGHISGRWYFSLLDLNFNANRWVATIVDEFGTKADADVVIKTVGQLEYLLAGLGIEAKGRGV